ncbi:MAG: TetR/AcrR family transcriptional regulator [Mycobacterium sp.]
MPKQSIDDRGDWQERAVTRSLGTARARALSHSSQFLAAAMELAEETGRLDFTIRSLVDKSKLSTKAFYQYFDGKDDLLLAMYENLIGRFVDDLREEVLAPKDPLAQLETFCRAYLTRAAQSQTVGGRALTVFALRLEIDRPDDFVKSYAPQLELLTEILTGCVEAGSVRDDLAPAKLAVLLSSTLMSVAQTGVLHTGVEHVDLTGDDVWSWCRLAVGAPEPTAKRRPRRRQTGVA